MDIRMIEHKKISEVFTFYLNTKALVSRENFRNSNEEPPNKEEIAIEFFSLLDDIGGELNNGGMKSVEFRNYKITMIKCEFLGFIYVHHHELAWWFKEALLDCSKKYELINFNECIGWIGRINNFTNFKKHYIGFFESLYYWVKYLA